MATAAYDRAYLEVVRPELEAYLHADELYRTLHVDPPAGEPPFPSLTIGNILLAYARLRAQDPAAAETLWQPIAALRQQWRVHWEQKARRELHARLQRWADYLRSLESDPSQADFYRYEVRQRVIVQLLGEELNGFTEEEQKFLRRVDRVLRAIFEPGAWIWEPELQPAFPRETFWYLYGKPSESLP